LGVLLAVVGGTLSLGAGEASAALEFCENAGDRACARLTVPLDRSGAVPGTIKLRIERQKAKHSARPPLFLIAGGPGQSAIEAFDGERVGEMLGTEARSRDVVVMDLRGTGRSGLLDCPMLRRGRLGEDEVTGCAARLGRGRDHYSSADQADDIDAVREALGAPRIALLGVSYGTHVALTYAHRYPDRVERLVLDSIVGPGGVDAFDRPSMAAVPRVADAICGKRLCRGFTSDAGGDIARLAARLDRRPIEGLVTGPDGRRRWSWTDGGRLLDLAVASDMNPFVAAEIPAAVSNALRGDVAPLLRAQAHAAAGDAMPDSPRRYSWTANVATLCVDTLLPWGPLAPLDDRDDRRVAAGKLLKSLPANAFAPFGARTAGQSDVLDRCRGWPSSLRASQNSGAPPAIDRLPDVPALLIAGGLDVRTPVESARAVASQLPRAELVVVGNVGHSVLGHSLHDCAGRTVRRFLAGGAAGRCGAGPRSPFSRPWKPAPTALRGLRASGGVGRVGRTVTAVQLTVVDGFSGLIADVYTQLLNADPNVEDPFASARLRLGALRGGSYVTTRDGFKLKRASLVPGVHVSGALTEGRKGVMRGAFTVSGPAAASGRLTLRSSVLRGVVGGRPIRVRFPVVRRVLGGLASASIARSARTARTARALAGVH
jgi:pimeloyl-ACP methyl ester carboxylesterase